MVKRTTREVERFAVGGMDGESERLARRDETRKKEKSNKKE